MRVSLWNCHLTIKYQSKNTCGKFWQNQSEFRFDSFEDRYCYLVTSNVIRVSRSFQGSGCRLRFTSSRTAENNNNKSFDNKNKSLELYKCLTTLPENKSAPPMESNLSTSDDPVQAWNPMIWKPEKFKIWMFGRSDFKMSGFLRVFLELWP